MRKLVLLFMALVWILSACSGLTVEATEPAVPVTGTEEAPAVTDVVTEASGDAAAAPEIGTTAEAASPAVEVSPAAGTPAPQDGGARTGIVTYTIVPEESTVTYEVGETFFREGNVFNTAVGQTQGVAGEIQVNFDQPQASSLGPLTIDISGFTSDSARRDGAIRDRFLQSTQFPTVTFTAAQIEGLPERIEMGVEYPLRLHGDLTIRDTTKPATFDARVRLQEDALTGQATTTFLMSDFGFGPIDILGMLKTEDEVKITVDLVARPSQAQTSSEPAPAATVAAPTQVEAAALNCTSPAEPTPAMTEGPYFKAGSPERASLIEPGMGGTRLILTGYVLTADCQPVPGAMLDFWQADDQGAYDNTGFRLRGHQFTDKNGSYRLETVVPGQYPGRTEHIHLKIQAPGGPVLTSQLFFPDVQANQSDRIFSDQLLITVVETGEEAIQAVYNFILG